MGSTCEEYEDTAAHPAVIMHSVWDFSQVDVNAPGVYKVTGTFAAPEGCTVDQELTVPEAVCLYYRSAPGSAGSTDVLCGWRGYSVLSYDIRPFYR